MDLEIVRFFNSLPEGIVKILFQFITTLGESLIIIGIFSCIYLVIDKKLGEKLIYIALFSMSVNGVIKTLVNRKRPFQVDETIIKRKSLTGDTATGSSFPSGHTQSASTTYFSLANVLKKWYYYVISAILVIMVAISRMYLGVHFFTDVLVGAILGIVFVFLIGYLYDKLEKHRIWLFIGMGIILTAFVPFMTKATSFDGIKAIGIYWGYVVGVTLEHKFVNFTTDGMTFKKACLRLLVGLPIIAFVYLGGKMLFPSTWVFGALRYFLVGVTGFFVIPWAYKVTKI